MSDFIEQNNVTSVNSSEFLWVDKYRPKNVDDYIGSTSVKDSLKSFMDKQTIPNLLFFGSAPGTGKTTAAKILVNNIDCDYLYINASSENGVDVIRNKITNFASTMGFHGIKIVILDECDYLTPEAQGALRNVIETFISTTRFIFTCNYVEKVIGPIRSRLQEFEVVPPSKKDVAIKLKQVLDKESVTHSIEDIGYIVNTYYPDMRKIYNFAQQYSIDGKFCMPKAGVIENDAKQKLVQMLKEKAPFNQIRQVIADADVTHFESYYQELYDKIEEYACGKEVVIILEIAESMYQSALVVDKEITFAACIARILKQLSK